MATAQVLQGLARTEPERLAHAFGDTLRDFGYQVTDGYCYRAISDWLMDNAAPPAGMPARFIHKWLANGQQEEEED